MTDIEQALEFYKIKEQLSNFALTDKAKETIQNLTPHLSENRLAAAQRETREARTLIEKAGNPPLVSLQGMMELIAAAGKGDCLSAGELEETGTALVAVERLKTYLERCRIYEISLAYEAEKLDAIAELKEAIRMQIRGGRVEDSASKLLKSLREDIERTSDRMREKAESVIRSNKECMSDSFSTIRNGHVCIPVKKEYKFRISGTVIDKSSTGNTLFIEPAQAAKYYEELMMLKLDEENEERRILYTLTAMVADASEQMEQNIHTIEKLDFIFAKGKLSIEQDAVEPRLNTDRRICLKDARHPLMDRAVCVPLQFEIGNGINGIVITGPNTGGKTVAIKTVALNCMMAQCGLHVTCSEADICMSSQYLCDIGDGQNLSENLSTFSAHIMNVLDILKRMDKDSLVIMDELGSGTDPTEGMGIAVSILEELKNSGALFLVTTHYPEVKEYAAKEEKLRNARMAFDKESLKPLYQLVIGEAGESCAFYIAKKLGMPGAMLKRAALAAYGREDAALEAGADDTELVKVSSQKIQKKKKVHRQEEAEKYRLGDSVMVLPDKKIGIVCQTADEKGVLRVQLPDKKIWINHKRIRLHVRAEELYPEDYDFSIIFDTVENRKLRHQMERKYTEGTITYEEQ
ncbi:MAG: DNA mismatch repair protein MutS [Lachnospiraceae bacterium]|nr:DNA mismatch repair protein MutS [Lachnospiraceae bacterium]